MNSKSYVKEVFFRYIGEHLVDVYTKSPFVVNFPSWHTGALVLGSGCISFADHKKSLADLIYSSVKNDVISFQTKVNKTYHTYKAKLFKRNN